MSLGPVEVQCGYVDKPKPLKKTQFFNFHTKTGRKITHRSAMSLHNCKCRKGKKKKKRRRRRRRKLDVHENLEETLIRGRQNCSYLPGLCSRKISGKLKKMTKLLLLFLLWGANF